MKANAVAVLLIVSLGACVGLNIVEKAEELGATTLLSFLVKANLNETLTGAGPFTVFAPTNDAFAALSQDLVDELNRNTSLLTSVLLYHVIAANVSSSALSNDMMAASVQGPNIRINVYDVQGTTKVLAAGSQVTAPDQAADNGIIHVVNNVLMAPTADIPTLASSRSDLSTLVTALQTAELVDALKGGNLTVFAPVNSAFDAVEDLNDILADKTKLTALLTYHVVPSTVYSAALYDGMEVTTLQGEKLTVTISNGNVKIGDATVTEADISSTNGVIHIINAVLVPDAVDPSSAFSFMPSILSLLISAILAIKFN